MAVTVADEGILQFDNASNALQDVSSDIQSFQLALNVNGSTYHALDSRWAKALEGGVSATLNITYYNDTTATELAGYIREMLLHASNKGGARSVRIQSPDGSTGSTQYDFEVKAGGAVDLSTKTAGSGDAETLTIALNVDGSITESTIA